MKDGIYFTDALSLQMPEHTHVLKDKKVTELKSGQTLVDSLKKGDVLEAQVPATHSGRITNSRLYPGRHVKDATGTWIEDYPKAWLSRHPSDGGMAGIENAVGNLPKILGRVSDAAYVHLVTGDAWLKDHENPTDGPGSGYINLTARIADRDAVERMLLGMTKTVSVGAHTSSMSCSICAQDWKVDGVCDHMPGTIITDDDGKSKLAFLITGPKYYDHVAEVDRPADKYAVISSTVIVDSHGFLPKMTASWEDAQVVIPTRLAIVDSQGTAILGLDEDKTKKMVDSGQATGKTQIIKPEIKIEDSYSKLKAGIVASLSELEMLSDTGSNETCNLVDNWYKLSASERREVQHSFTTKIGPGKSIPVSDDLQIGIVLDLVDKGYLKGNISADWIKEQLLVVQNNDGVSGMPGTPTEQQTDAGKATTLSDSEREAINDSLEQKKVKIADLEIKLKTSEESRKVLADKLEKVEKANLALQADKVVDLRVTLGDIDSPASAEARQTLVDNLVARGTDSLAHTISDLEERVTAKITLANDTATPAEPVKKQGGASDITDSEDDKGKVSDDDKPKTVFGALNHKKGV